MNDRPRTGRSQAPPARRGLSLFSRVFDETMLGRQLPADSGTREVHDLPQAFNAMLRRLRAERRCGAMADAPVVFAYLKRFVNDGREVVAA